MQQNQNWPYDVKEVVNPYFDAYGQFMKNFFNFEPVVSNKTDPANVMETQVNLFLQNAHYTLDYMKEMMFFFEENIIKSPFLKNSGMIQGSRDSRSQGFGTNSSSASRNTTDADYKTEKKAYAATKTSGKAYKTSGKDKHTEMGKSSLPNSKMSTSSLKTSSSGSKISSTAKKTSGVSTKSSAIGSTKSTKNKTSVDSPMERKAKTANDPAHPYTLGERAHDLLQEKPFPPTTKSSSPFDKK